MRAIDSAIALSVHLGRPLRLIWPISAEMGCGFGDLFEPVPRIVGVEQPDLRRLGGALRYRLGIELLRRRNRAYRDRDHYALKTRGYDFRGIGGGVLHYALCHPFFENPRPFAEFVPVGDLRSRIDALATDGRVGIHVRRTDNARAIERSPLSAFMAAMEAEISADPGVGFFLATDSPEDERVLTERFPARITAQSSKSLDRSTASSARDAVVDLYALSRCRKIIGSDFSSFTDVASGIRGVPRVIAGVKDLPGG
ncbi:hypothetical protein ASA1KI_38930 [Opitutales bacterium ASA1]|nr:hypothetical protein ASA1KI_38930 [Opitutales bacterium ASA1]